MAESSLFSVLPLYQANLNATERVVVNQGGTSSGKTYSIMQVLFVLGMQEERKVITVVGQDVPNLKKGAYRDAKTILDGSPLVGRGLKEDWMETAFDIRGDGFPRLRDGKADIGCYQSYLPATGLYLLLN